jgi:hypothetical protein
MPLDYEVFLEGSTHPVRALLSKYGGSQTRFACVQSLFTLPEGGPSLDGIKASFADQYETWKSNHPDRDKPEL